MTALFVRHDGSGVGLARVLLALALTRTSKHEEIERIFLIY